MSAGGEGVPLRVISVSYRKVCLSDDGCRRDSGRRRPEEQDLPFIQNILKIS
jgi:hypothetical protein